MVEQVRVNPEEVRGYGNICEGHTLEDFIVSNSGLAKEKENVHGALTDVYKLIYSLYGLMFDFDKGNKQLYLQTAEADTLSFGFDTANKQLYLVDEEDTGFNLGFDEDTNELYITDDAPPIVHNYTLALDSESYTTTGSLSVSATLLDDGVAVEGATVSFTGGDSAVTATTNSSGVATATVTFSASGTLTASYSNVSDTASVTVQTYLFYDACNSASGLSNYDGVILGEGSSTSYTQTYDSTMNAYKIGHSNGNSKMIHIPILDNQDNFTLELDFYYPTNATAIIHTGIGIANSTTVFTGIGTLYDNGWYSGNSNYSNKSWGGWANKTSISNPTQQWNHLKLTVQDKTVTVVMTVNNTDYTYTKTLSNSFSNKQFGILLQGNATSLYAYVKEIKAQAL